MNYRDLTVQTYDNAAADMARHFAKYVADSVEPDIRRTLELAGDPRSPRIVEIGCGPGQHAATLLPLAGWYEGFDPSSKLLAAAKKHVPKASFVQADAQTYDFPNNLDAVFAFASLLHLNRDELQTLFDTLAVRLKPGGTIYATLKEADNYQEKIQEDKFGIRQFFLYSIPLIQELAGDAFELMYKNHYTAGPEKKRWFTIILRRKK